MRAACTWCFSPHSDCECTHACIHTYRDSVHTSCLSNGFSILVAHPWCSHPHSDHAYPQRKYTPKLWALTAEILCLCVYIGICMYDCEWCGKNIYSKTLSFEERDSMLVCLYRYIYVWLWMPTYMHMWKENILPNFELQRPRFYACVFICVCMYERRCQHTCIRRKKM